MMSVSFGGGEESYYIRMLMEKNKNVKLLILVSNGLMLRLCKIYVLW